MEQFFEMEGQTDMLLHVVSLDIIIDRSGEMFVNQRLSCSGCKECEKAGLLELSSVLHVKGQVCPGQGFHQLQSTTTA